jgi:TRAP-type C4-dicarboxylate transport system permease small subunit
MTRIDWATKALPRALAVIGLGVLLCFAAMTILDGLMRFFFASPIDVVRDGANLVAAFSVACCLPVAIVERSNITIRFMSHIAGRRVGQLVDVAAAILVEVVLISITWQFVVFANHARLDGSATWMLRIPTAPVWAAVALIFGISAILQIVVGIKTARGDYVHDH